MTTEPGPGPHSPAPGHYLASDGQQYPLPAGYAVAQDGQLRPIPPGYAVGSDGQLRPIPPGYAVGSDGQPGPIQSPPFGSAPTSSAPWTWNAPSVLVVAGAGMAFIGSFLPWATIGAFSKAGTDGDGVLTLLLAVAAAAFGIFGLPRARKGMLIASLIAAVLILAIGAYDMIDIGSTEGPFDIEVSVGGGLYLTVLGAIAGVIGPILAMARRSS
jgi:hypothetical protein